MANSRAGSLTSKVIVSRDEARRVDAFVMKCRGKDKGSIRTSAEAAAARLGVGHCTVLSAVGQGSMMRSTYERLFAALDREEAAE